MRRLLFMVLPVALIVVVTGCGADVPADEQEIKKEKLEAYRQQLNELKAKIAELEADLGNTEVANRVNVDVVELQPTRFEQFIEVAGNVSTDRNIIVSPETAGVIQNIFIKEGENVRKGQILGRLNTESIEQSIEEVKVNLQMARTLYERRKNLWEQSIGSEVDFLQAESNMKALEKRLQGLEAQLEMAVIKAPIDGVVDDLIQKQGEMAGPAIPFARIVNLEDIYITADVSEQYLGKIHPGDSVSIYFPVSGTQKVATVYRTSSVIDPDSRTFSVRVNLSNPGKALQPNLLGELKMRVALVPDALVVPSLIVKKDFKGEFIFVVDDEDNNNPVAEKRYIKTSIRDNNESVVSSGLTPGVKIISSGYAQVTDGTPLKINN
ncbi:efflux RND transporter periplasmic adaptor subunit [Anaerophaga thermohalophila]|uniref:efflux RND transporter periplasmic adaptor subunit n=1 Tax=Anaerophaga thermohalophila TaxID=177400 RepID=UPI0002EFDF19|nr:efflux RND transporter periplasmic adaptor subunit [Anaerophaga thermohalophila]